MLVVNTRTSSSRWLPAAPVSQQPSAAAERTGRCEHRRTARDGIVQVVRVDLWRHKQRVSPLWHDRDGGAIDSSGRLCLTVDINLETGLRLDHVTAPLQTQNDRIDTDTLQRRVLGEGNIGLNVAQLMVDVRDADRIVGLDVTCLIRLQAPIEAGGQPNSKFGFDRLLLN